MKPSSAILLASLFLLVGCKPSSIAHSPMGQNQLVSAGEGKAYFYNAESKEIWFLSNGVMSAVKSRQDIKTYLEAVVDNPQTKIDVKDFSIKMLDKFYNTKKIGKYWVTEKD